MYGRKVKLRFLFVVIIFITLVLTVFLVLKSLEENVIYFQSPSEINSAVEINTSKIRVGGMVKKIQFPLILTKLILLSLILKMK